MSTIIKTIQSDNKENFDKKVNIYLKQGWELVEESYNILNNNTYSSVIKFNKNKYDFVKFWDNGLVYQSCDLLDKNKKFDLYSDNPNIEGIFKQYFKDGSLEILQHWSNGKRVGEWFTYNNDRNLEYNQIYKGDTMVQFRYFCNTITDENGLEIDRTNWIFWERNHVLNKKENYYFRKGKSIRYHLYKQSVIEWIDYYLDDGIIEKQDLYDIKNKLIQTNIYYPISPGRTNNFDHPQFIVSYINGKKISTEEYTITGRHRRTIKNDE